MAERGATQTAAAAADYSVGSEKWVVMTHTDVVLVCLICGFLVMGCVVIYFHQCADRLLARDFAGDRIVRRRRRGLDSDVIDAFPRFRYSDVKALTIGNGALECAVCLNEFDDGEDKLRLLPRCCHVFHTHCIDEWLAAHVTCPVCRANLLPGSAGEFHGDSVPSHDPVSDEVTQEIVEINSVSRERIAGKFPRSHSTGHSLIQSGGHGNRFTLRLPEEVKNRMVTTGLPGNPSHKAIQGEMSSRKGYRSISIGTGSERVNHTYYERLDKMDRIDRWGFKPTAVLFSSGVSSRWSKEDSGGGAEDSSTIPRISSMEKDDDFAERYLNKLRSYSPVLSSPIHCNNNTD